MYGKLFPQMYDGTLGTRGPWEALVTFQQFIILADRQGVVDMTAGAISRRTLIPEDIITKGIEELMKPDPESRSPLEDGKRLVPLDPNRNWGWRLVNYEHYRRLRNEDERREYHRQYWHKRKERAQVDGEDSTHDSTPLNGSTALHATQPMAVSSMQKAVKTKQASPAPPPTASEEPPAGKLGIPKVNHQDVIDAYHELCPTLPRVLQWTDRRQSMLRQRWREYAEYERRKDRPWQATVDGVAAFRRFFKFVAESEFLTGRVKPKPGEQAFTADLEWLLNAANFVKVCEGRYS